jgi:CBS domain-containing protein
MSGIGTITRRGRRARTLYHQGGRQDLTRMAPTDSLDDAVRLMLDKAIRRLPMVEGDKAVGIVSIGDLAVSQDPRSALGQISAAPPNR